MSLSLCRPESEPDFQPIVDKTLSVFAVYTGVVLTYFVRDYLFSDDNMAQIFGFSAWAHHPGSWVAVAVTTLLLRYVIGSAVHLNKTYVPAVARRIDGLVITEIKTYKSTSVCWLYIDLLFLIVFGILGILMTRATGSIESIGWHAIYIMGAGVLWSAIAMALRPGDRKIGALWFAIDVVQIVLTYALVIAASWDDLSRAVCFGILYVIFLYADVYFVVYRLR